MHERITPSQAIQLAKDVEPYKLFYFEYPLRPEHLGTFRIMRRQVATPIAWARPSPACGRERN